MTSDNRSDKLTLVLGGRAFSDRLVATMPELTRQIVAALDFDSDVSPIVQKAIKTFCRVLITRDQPSEDELGWVRESAARRAEEGLPIESVLSGYHVGAAICADALQREAEPGDLEDLLTIQRLLLGFLQRMTSAVAAGYFEQRRTMYGDEHSARQALLIALLDGHPAEPVAQRVGIRLPAWYIVLHLSLPALGKRRLRRLRVELEHACTEPVLSMLSDDGGIVLLPVSTVDWKRVSQLVQRLQSAGGVDLVAGAAETEPAGVPAAAALSREVVGVARAIGRPPGLYRLDDLLVEYQLTRPSPARARLAGLLDPIDVDLLATLRAYVDNGQSRQRAARILHVHPNTVDYRLRKIAVQTGLDATRPADLPRIAAALAARDIGTSI